MFEAVIGIVALLAVSGLFFWLVSRSLRLRSAVARWAGVVLAGLLGLLVGVLGVVALVGFLRVNAPRTSPPPEFSASTDAQVIARGEYLADILCTDCHSPDKNLPLSGGGDLGEGSPMPLGSYPAYNLTPAGKLKDWSDGEIFQAIRHNIDPEGRRLVFMNTTGIGTLGDEDIQALVAYLRSQPAVGDETRQEKPNLLAYLMIGGGMIPTNTRPDQIDTPAPAADVVYGEYMVSFLSCRDCHGPDLTGGTSDLVPKGPNLIQAVSGWTGEEFTTAMRTGLTPDGRRLANALMPYETYGKADDIEMQAMYLYLKSLSQP